jgi:branched-chain amino acid transport system ATP-binding protein
VRLELQNVTAAYGDTTALRDVSLVVPSGRVAALLGPNGAGKTTLLSTASGLLKPRNGRVLIDGKNQTGASPDRLVKAGLCHITEGRSIFPGLTVADNLKMFSRKTATRQTIDRAISAFPRLGERLYQLAGTLSGGEQQMLALARAYAQQAPIVMLDEVSMGLAPILVDEIFEFLGRLAAEGHSLLIVEQYVAKALALADLVYLLVRGRLVFAGEPAEIEGTDIFAHYLGAEAGLTDASARGTDN